MSLRASEGAVVIRKTYIYGSLTSCTARLFKYFGIAVEKSQTPRYKGIDTGINSATTLMSSDALLLDSYDKSVVYQASFQSRKLPSCMASLT